MTFLCNRTTGHYSTRLAILNWFQINWSKFAENKNNQESLNHNLVTIFKRAQRDTL